MPKDCFFKINWSDSVEYTDSNRNGIPTDGGFYEIQEQVSDGGYTRRYVGRSDNLRRRYSGHLSNDEPNEKLRQFLREKHAFFRYVTTDDEDTRKDVEKGLYDKYKHSFNDPDNPPSGSGVCSIIDIEETSP